MRMTYVSGVCVLCLLTGFQLPGGATPPTSGQKLQKDSATMESLGTQHGEQLYRKVVDGKAMVAFRKDGAVVRLQVENARHRLRVLPQGGVATAVRLCTPDSQVIADGGDAEDAVDCESYSSAGWLILDATHQTINNDQSLWGRPRELALFGRAQQSIQVHTWEEGEDGPGEREIAGMVLLHVFDNRVHQLLEVVTETSEILWSDEKTGDEDCDFASRMREGFFKVLKRGARAEVLAVHHEPETRRWRRTHWRFSPEKKAFEVVSDRVGRPKTSDETECY